MLSGLLKRPAVKILLIASFSIIISYLYFGKNLKAEMGAIDDHRYLSSGVLQDHSLIWSNFINAPEIKSFGNSDRFRIIFDLAGNVEAAVFGMNAAYFYLVNIIVFAFFVFCVFYITYKNLGIKWAAPFTILVVGQSYFAHIFTRLGPAEVWTILGLSIYALGFSSLYQKSQLKKHLTSWKECCAMIAGSVFMIGSKENFAIIGVLVVALLALLYFRKKLTKMVIFSSIFILAMNVYQVLHIFLTQRQRGVDFYQNDAGTLHRIVKIVGGAFSGDALILSSSFLFFLLVITTYFLFEYKKRKMKMDDQRLINLFFKPLFIAFVLAIFYLFNLYIYNGVLYTVHRYAFPSIFVGQLLLLAFIKWIYDFSQYYFPKFKPDVLRVAYFAMMVGSLVLMINSMKYSRRLSAINVEATTAFQAKLKESVNSINRHPGYPVVFSTYQPFDYEPLISTSLYLKYYGTENNMMVKTNYDLAQIDNEPLTKWVANENIKLEQEGGIRFTPYDVGLNKQCFNFDFSGETTDGKCNNLGKMWRLGAYPY